MNNLAHSICMLNCEKSGVSRLTLTNIRNKVVDTPRELSISCGISIVFSSDNIGRAKLILMRMNLSPYVKLYMISGDLFKKYMPINI